MLKRKLWRALAALLCAALLCPAFALAEEDGLAVNDTAGEALGLEMTEAFDGALPDLPGLDLADSLDLDGLYPDVVPDADGSDALALGGSALSNEGESDPSGDTPAPEDVVPLVASYTGEPLTKVYDCNKYGAYIKKNDDGTTETVYVIEALKTISSLFKLTPANGKSLVEGHKNVGFKVTLTKQFLDKDDTRTSADVGAYEFEFTLSLTGADAAWYTLENPVVKVPATVTPRDVTVSPRANLTKVYGAQDPVYADGAKFTLKYTNGDVAVQQDVSGVPTYGVPTFTSDQATAVKYLIAEAKLKERDFFPGFLSREAGEKAGKYRITKGNLDFGSNFRITVAEGYFTILPRDINDSSITVKAIADKTYTGKAIKPAPVVRYNGRKLKLGADYKLKYAHNKTPGSATVTVSGKGNFTGSRKLTFRIVLKPTAITKLTSGKGQITVAWKKGSLNAGYQVAYSTDADFLNALTKTVKGIGTTRATLKDLQSGTVYYVRVRTYRKVGGNTYYSAWSKAKKVRTK